MSANGALTILVKRVRKPECASVGQRAKTGIEMIKARIHQLDGDHQTAQQFAYRAMRLDVAAEFVPAKEGVVAKQSIAFALEIQILG